MSKQTHVFIRGITKALFDDRVGFFTQFITALAAALIKIKRAQRALFDAIKEHKDIRGFEKIIPGVFVVNSDIANHAVIKVVSPEFLQL